MEITNATVALAALGQTTRLAVFRLLVEAGPSGRMAGEIAEALGLPGATLSFHLKELVAAGLVQSEARGWHVCYRADFAAMNRGHVELEETLTYPAARSLLDAQALARMGAEMQARRRN